MKKSRQSKSPITKRLTSDEESKDMNEEEKSSIGNSDKNLSQQANTDRKTEYNSKLEFEIREKESQLAGLKAEIRSRQRLISQLTDKNGDLDVQDKFKRLEDEIFVRDRQIEILNDRVIGLDAKLKENSSQASSKQKDQLIEKLQDERNKLQSEIDRFDDKLKQSDTTLKEAQTQWFKEKEELLLVQESMNEDHETLKTQLDQNTVQINESKADIKRLADIVSEMSKLNTDLNEKISVLSTQLEKANTEYYHAHLKAQQTDEMEGSLAKYMNDNTELKIEIKNLTTELEKLAISKTTLENTVNLQTVRIEDILARLRNEIDKCNELENKLRTSESTYLGELSSIERALQNTLAELNDVRNQLSLQKIQEDEEKAEKLREAQLNIRNLEENLREKNKMYNLVKIQEDTLKSRITELENKLQSNKQNSGTREDQFNLKIEKLEEDLKGSRYKCNETKKNLDEKEIELTKSQTQCVGLANRLEDMKKKNEIFAQRNSQLEQAAKTARLKLTNLEKEQSE